MTITDTSLEAYISIDTKYDATIKKRIINLLAESPVPLNNREIGKLLRLPINTITGRTNGLLNDGILIRAGKVRDRETGRLAYVLTIAEEQE
jgi:DNA-binding Lrp family transcriptional regulator